MRASCKVVGMVAGGREHIVAYTREGDPVLLVPEPDNKFDPNAIAVYTAPRSLLEEPEAMVSSVQDEQHVGTISDVDRRMMVDRQAGYVPANLARDLRLPLRGIVGWVSRVRWKPDEYDRKGRLVLGGEPRVAGFDVTAWFTRRDDAEIASAIDDGGTTR